MTVSSKILKTNLSLLVLVMLVVSAKPSLGQACTSMGLYSQNQVDSFPLNYPNCNQLTGTLVITGSDIVSLDSLYSIKTVTGNLEIIGNPLLKSLSGLNNLDSIDGSLLVLQNDSILNFHGLQELKYVSGDLDISHNSSLRNFRGLDNINWTANFKIFVNSSLDSLAGLENLSRVGAANNGLFQITGNARLKCLLGLQDIDLGTLKIWQNDSLESLDGLQNNVNIQSLSLSTNRRLKNISALQNRIAFAGDLHITGSPYIKHVEDLQGLKSVGGDLVISVCMGLKSLKGLDSLTTAGLIRISNIPSLQNLNHLESLDSVQGHFIISDNDSLKNLNGLENLKRINGDLILEDDNALWTLNGLDNLSYIGDRLILDSDSSLYDLSALINLREVGSKILIRDNKVLSSVAGLDSVDGNSSLISFISIYRNPQLTFCTIKSICDYIATGLPTPIFENEVGCDSPIEVATACQTISLFEAMSGSDFEVYPNPVKGSQVNIKVGDQVSLPYTLKLHNVTGQEIINFENQFEKEMTLNIENYPNGMYFILVKDSNNQFKTQKLNIQ